MKTFAQLQPAEKLNLKELSNIKGGDTPPSYCKTVACTSSKEDAKCATYVCESMAFPK